MTAFEFFFSFYGLLLGFSVAELVGGFARVLHERKRVRFGALTPLLAIFVAMDIATFWVQAWVIFRNAPFNFALLVLGLVVASVFYVAATLVFPRDVKALAVLDDHFWQQRSLVLLCVLGANLIMILLVFAVAGPNGELAAVLGQRWFGTVFFVILTLIAAFVRGRTPMLVLLTTLVLYHGYNVFLAVISLIERGGWSLLQAPVTTP